MLRHTPEGATIRCIPISGSGLYREAMSGYPSLLTLTTECSRSFRRFAAVLVETYPERVRLDEIVARWNDHYCGEFADLDRMMMCETGAGRRPSDRFLAISVSHHNLHRLIEVLELEIGAAPLSASQVPERITDLREIVARLDELLQTSALSPTSTESRHA